MVTSIKINRKLGSFWSISGCGRTFSAMLRPLRRATHAVIFGFTIFLVSLSSNNAFAATNGMAVTDVNLRAGPSTYYPVVGVLPRSASLAVYGCLEGGSWCDISWGSRRGWVAANYINVFYNGQATVLTRPIAPAVGVATIAFTAAYWNNHYKAQPWYGQWNQYYVGSSRSVTTGCNDNGCGGAAVTRGIYGGERSAVGGCNNGNCGGAAVTRGPYGGGRATVGGCNDQRCGGAAITRGPTGNIHIRQGSFNRP